MPHSPIYSLKSQSKQENVIYYKISRGHKENDPDAHQKHMLCDGGDDAFNVISTINMI